jgi:hypothetical protein
VKRSLSLTVGVVLALCTNLLLARPKYAAAEIERTNSEYSRPGGDSIQEQIVSKEREELDSLKAGNLELFGSLLADNTVFVDAQGPASKAQVVKNVAEFRLLEYSMEDVRFVPVSAASGLITYKVTEKGVSHGREFMAQVYISAVWTKHGGKWICLFSQETAAK